MSAGFTLHAPDQIKRRVMFALELVDPVTGRLVPDLDVAAPGFGRPVRTPSGRYVWLDVDPPADRHVKVTARSRRGVFAPFEVEFDAPERTPGQDAEALRQTHDLTPTGLYDPPPGFTAAAGAVVASDADRTPLPGLSIKLGFAPQAPAFAPIAVNYAGVTDARGLFVTVAPLNTALANAAPHNDARPGDGLKGWLEVTGEVAGAPAETRYAPLGPLRPHRLLRIAEPLEWDGLDEDPPP